jgi:integrase
MINRSNWKLVKAFIAYRVQVGQLAPSSAKLEKRWLLHLLEWADERPFGDAPEIRPSFPQYLLTARRDDQEGRLSEAYIKKVIGAAQRFFQWLSRHRRDCRTVGGIWLDTVRPPRMAGEPDKHEAVTVEEVRAMAQAPVETGREKRIRAGAIFLFLSGMRVGAFVSMPLAAVDLDQHRVKQWPSLGVRTKFKGHATTYLLDVPDLLDVVRAWDSEVRAVLPPRGAWFAHLLPSGNIDPQVREPGVHRRCRLNKDLHEWLARVELPYHSPHKFRHGHATYALKRCKDVADLKAVSQNLMHSSLTVTDSIYSVLSTEDVGERIAGLSGEEDAHVDIDERLVAEIVREAMRKVKG